MSCSIQARDNGTIHERKVGAQGVQRKRDRENRLLHIGLSLFPFSTVFATTLVDLSRKEG